MTMRAALAVLLIVLAGCTAPDNGMSDASNPEGHDPAEGDASGPPVLSSFGLDISPYDPSTGQAGDMVFSHDLMYDDGRVYNDRPFVEFGWMHEYYGDQRNIEYWFYTPLHTTIRAPTSGEVSIDYLEHTDDWAVHIRSDPDWTVSFEHVVDMVVEDGQWVDAGDAVAHAAPRPGFGKGLAMVELAVWHGGEGITKYCPGDFLAPELKPEYAAKFARLAEDWEGFIGADVYDEDSWVSAGCLVEQVNET
jgi:hypothetical protein